MVLSNDFGIDPGSHTLKIFDRYGDTFYSDYNALAADGNGRIIAWGEEAYRMRGSTPKSISVKTSVQAGKISDVLLLESILEPVLYKEHRFLGIRPKIYFSVPADMTEIERRAYASISRRGRLKNCDVFLIEKAFADAIASGLPVTDSKGIMILNVGASHTTASVISNGRIILERSLMAGGDNINVRIMTSIRKKNNLSIGALTAEDLKCKYCSLSGESSASASVSGLDTINGLPRGGLVTANTITQAVKGGLDDLLEMLTEFIHRIPPQVLEFVRKEGIFLCGGCTRIEGIDDYLMSRLHFPVILSDAYEYSTVKGIKKIISSNEFSSLIKAPVLRQKR